MTLTIDAGNSNIAIGLFDGDQVTGHWRLSSRSQWTADEFLLNLEGLLRIEGDRSEIDSVVISSVVPHLLSPIEQSVARLLAIKPVVVSTALTLPVTVCTDTPGELGSDLLANAVAGYLITGGATVVVDFGTALTFTTVDAQGCVRGVAIAPGFRTGMHGLVSRTAALPMVDLSPPSEGFIGTNTTSAIRSGMLNGYAGLVDGLVAGIVGELKTKHGVSKVTVLATGGESSLVAPQCRRIDRVEPWLTLRGLAEIGRRNRPSGS